jgi:DNA-binding Lrp family transcriptional regulator
MVKESKAIEAKVDEKDKKIMKALFEDARASVAELEKRTRIRRDSIARRLKKLRKEKVIETFSPMINPAFLGLPNLALLLIRTKTNPQKDKENFVKKLKENKFVLHFAKLIGKFDYFSVMVYKDTGHLNKLIEEIKAYVSGFIEDFEVFSVAEEYKVEDMSSLL